MPAPKPNTFHFAVIGGLSLTAVAAFIAGRMSGGGESAHAAPGGAGMVRGPGGTGGAGAGEYGAAEDGAFSHGSGAFGPAGAEGGAAGEKWTLAQVTGGKPLNDWMERVLAQDDPRFRLRSLLRLTGAIQTPAEAEAVLNAMVATRGGGNGGNGSGRGTEYGMVMARMVHLDPQAALAYASKQEGGERSNATVAAMRTWTQADPAAALDWALKEGAKVEYGQPNQGNGRQRPADNVALVAVLEQMARTDLDQALKTAGAKLARPSTQLGKINIALDEATSGITDSMPFGGIQLGQLDTRIDELGRMSERTVGLLAAEMVNQRGSEAAKEALASMDNGVFKETYTRQLANRLAQENAASAAAWAVALPGGESKSSALATAVNQWAREDAAAAGHFLSQLPISPETDRARERYADRVADQDPEGALAWAETITNREQRDEAIEEVLEDWSRRDPEAARQWQVRRTMPR